MVIASMFVLHRGHGAGFASSVGLSRSPLAPQCGQNFWPMNIIPKQDGQATVARRAPQCSHFEASVAAAAPHIGQLKVSAGITSFHQSNKTSTNDKPSVIYARNDLPKGGLIKARSASPCF